MPNRHTHGKIGIVAGGGVTLLATKGVPETGRAVAVLAGALGGYIGGTAPDVLEPAIHSWHRSVCHSGMTGTAVVAAGVKASAAFQRDILSHAAALRTQRLALPSDHPDRFWLGLQEFALYFTYGATIGFVAGYASHLLLDMGTKRGIPIVCKGF